MKIIKIFVIIAILTATTYGQITLQGMFDKNRSEVRQDLVGMTSYIDGEINWDASNRALSFITCGKDLAYVYYFRNDRLIRFVVMANAELSELIVGTAKRINKNTRYRVIYAGWDPSVKKNVLVVER